MANVKKALVFLAQGAEEMEAVIAIDVLRRAGVDVTVAGVNINETNEPIKCSRQVNINADVALKALPEPTSCQFDVLVLPGGLEGSKNLAASPLVGQWLNAQQQAKRWIAAICAAPTALKMHKIGLQKQITSYPAMQKDLEDSYVYKTDRNVVIDEKLITSRGPGTAFEFALEIVKNICGAEEAQRVAKGLLLTTP